jgi:hypothetical protein
MLDSFVPSGAPVTLFLQPLHPAAVGVALEKLAGGGAERALIVLLEGVEELAGFLGCEDFSGAIREHRLLFAVSEGHLAEVLASRRGMPIPGTFIRTSHLADAKVQELIGVCQRIFVDEQRRRTERVEEIRGMLAARRKRGAGALGGGDGGKNPALACGAPRAGGASVERGAVLVSARRRFELWRGHVESDALVAAVRGAFGEDEGGVRVWAMDDVFSMSPLHLLEECVREGGVDLMVLQDVFRPDAHDLIPMEVGVVTWVTTGRVVSFETAGERDGLLLAEPGDVEVAREMGWPAERVRVATRPAMEEAKKGRGKGLAFVGDTMAAEMPESAEEYSSHKLLYERVESEMGRNPLVAGSDVGRYVERLREEMGIATGTFPMEAAVRRWAIPLWQQGVVRHLRSLKVEVGVWGKGWPAEFGARAIESREELWAVLSGAGVLVHPEPLPRLHAVESAGLPLLRPPVAGTTMAQFAGMARRMLASGGEVAGPQNALSIATLRGLGLR